ncbi:MAG: nitroreductase family protein [Prevotellaceae bacterium]|nr:nitroreductase family protein [Prevotellaceae bacterium]
MKAKNIIIILLCIVIVLLLAKILFCPGGKAECQSSQPAEGMDALTAIATRTSIRAYEETPVEEEKVETLLRAAMAAPTAANRQPWRFVVITERGILDSIPTFLPTARMLSGAPLAIVVCGDMSDTLPDEGREYWVQDASAATENLLLAAHAMGLGAVWCGVYPLQERVQAMQQMLDMPEGILPLNIVAIGYPAEQPEPKDKWMPEKIHYQRWDGTTAE